MLPLMDCEGFFKDCGAAEDVLVQAVASLGGETVRAFEGVCFTMFKPDAVLSGKLWPIIQRLEAAGLRFASLRLVQDASERVFEEVYKFNLTLNNSQNMAGAWWLNRQIYTIAPVAVGLLTTSADAGHDGIYGALKTLKGPSQPTSGRPGQIRWDLHATNKALNLLHASDGPISSLREALLFYTPDELAEAGRRIQEARRTTDALNRRHRACLAAAQLFSVPRQETGFWPVLQSVRCRLAMLSFTDRFAAEDGGLARALRAEGVRRPSDPTEELALLDTLSTSHALARKLAAERPPRDREAFEAFLALSDARGFGPDLAATLPGRLPRRLSVSPFETLVLQTSIHYLAEARRPVETVPTLAEVPRQPIFAAR